MLKEVRFMKIAVLCGGTSPEREVSLRSGAAVAKGLAGAGHEAVMLDVDGVRKSVKAVADGDLDLAFIALHGGWGEDGRLQTALDARSIRYTGSRAAACRLAMDKDDARRVMREAGIPVADGICVRPGDEPDLEGAIEKWGKIVIKPASGGSTVGVTITSDAIEARAGLVEVWETDIKAVVERYVPGREITAAVMGTGASAFSLPLVEIRPASGFYDYRSKYTAGASEYITPAPLDEKLAEEIQAVASRAHQALGCTAYSRVDLRVSDEEIAVLEINTAPGMTTTSLVPKAAAEYGWSFEELLEKMIDLSAI